MKYDGKIEDMGRASSYVLGLAKGDRTEVELDKAFLAAIITLLADGYEVTIFPEPDEEPFFGYMATAKKEPAAVGVVSKYAAVDESVEIQEEVAPEPDAEDFARSLSQEDISSAMYGMPLRGHKRRPDR